MDFLQRSEFLFEEFHVAKWRIWIPLTVDPLLDQVLVLSDVATVVRLVAVAVVAVWAPDINKREGQK